MTRDSVEVSRYWDRSWDRGRLARIVGQLALKLWIILGYGGGRDARGPRPTRSPAKDKNTRGGCSEKNEVD
jgi:hypothetical protein